MSGEEITIAPINLSGVSAEPPPMEAGDYELVLFESLLTTVGNGDNAGKPMLKLTWRPYPEWYPNLQNRRLFDNITIVLPDEASDKIGTIWRLVELGKALQMPEAEIASFDVRNLKKYVGTRVRAKVTNKTSDEYGTQSRPGKYKPSTGLPPANVDAVAGAASVVSAGAKRPTRSF
jgi:hypothetical protein